MSASLYTHGNNSSIFLANSVTAQSSTAKEIKLSSASANVSFSKFLAQFSIPSITSQHVPFPANNSYVTLQFASNAKIALENWLQCKPHSSTQKTQCIVRWHVNWLKTYWPNTNWLKQTDRISHWHNDKLTEFHTDRMINWSNFKLTEWQTDRISN